MPATTNMREALVLLALEGLDQRSLTPMREYELHQLVRDIQEVVGAPFRFLDRPISYSLDLQTLLKSLERAHYVDELILVRDGWVPRFEYQLSMIGRAQAQEERDRLRTVYPDYIERIDEGLDRFGASFHPPAPINPR